MKQPNVSVLMLSIILIVVSATQVSAQFTFRHSDCEGGTYTANSPYQSNLNTVLDALSSDTRITYGFYNFSAGRDPDAVHSLAFCRGDVPVGTCQVCIRDSANLLPQTCNQKQALGYSEYCTIFISNRSIYGNVQATPQWYLTGGDTDSVNDDAGFNQSLYGLMTTLQNRAAAGNSELKYAAGQVNLKGDQTLYGLVQCTPDLSSRSCVQCIQGSLTIFPACCVQPTTKASGVKIVKPSCFVQYDLSPFYGNVPNLTPPPLPPPPASINTTSTEVQKTKKTVNASVIVIPIVVTTILILVAVVCILLRKKKLRKSWVKFNKDDIKTLQSLQFSLGSIKSATNDFSDDFKLGKGGFGTVYKGVFSDGQEIAVKRLSRSSGQGDEQFKNEILILAKLQHKNLVRLLGFCLHSEEMLLIYEFVANRSLDYFIFASDPVQPNAMLWGTRYKIINGIARGLLYLHEESRVRIIHRDLKAANILLDEEFIPKIADFGMARLFDIDQTQTMTTRIVGTYGYMAPEYVLQGQVSMKSDVFSFGVLVLEILTGKRITSFLGGENPENLLSFAWKNWIEGTAGNILDPVLSAGFNTEILRCIHIGLLCVQENPEDRPNMSSIVLMLSDYSVSIQVPLQPAFFMEGNSRSDAPSDGYTSSIHLNPEAQQQGVH